MPVSDLLPEPEWNGWPEASPLCQKRRRGRDRANILQTNSLDRD
jgi:hypothetical protein